MVVEVMKDCINDDWALGLEGRFCIIMVFFSFAGPTRDVEGRGLYMGILTIGMDGWRGVLLSRRLWDLFYGEFAVLNA